MTLQTQLQVTAPGHETELLKLMKLAYSTARAHPEIARTTKSLKATKRNWHFLYHRTPRRVRRIRRHVHDIEHV